MITTSKRLLLDNKAIYHIEIRPNLWPEVIPGYKDMDSELKRSNQVKFTVKIDDFVSKRWQSLKGPSTLTISKNGTLQLQKEFDAEGMITIRPV